MPPGLRPREILDLLVISYLIYQAVLLVRGTAARQGLPWLAALGRSPLKRVANLIMRAAGRSSK